MKKIIYFAIVLIVILLGIYFLSQKPANGPMPEESWLDENVIIYKDEGFTPPLLKVRRTTEVTFVNESSGAMWPASAVHPTHTLYSAQGGCIGSTFDACEGIAPEGVWRFAFNIVGTWKYHNHLNPSQTGTIIVE